MRRGQQTNPSDINTVLLIEGLQYHNIQIWKMGKQDRPLWSEWWQYIVQRIEIEPQKRTVVMEFIIYLHYIVDYMLLWIIIQLRYVDSPIFEFDWPFIVVRIALALLFIIFQHPVYFLFNKLTNILQIILALQQYLLLEVLVFVVELVMCGCWSLSKEQRMVHFDSRFQIYGSFLKQIIFYLLLTVQAFIPDNYIQPDAEFLLLGSVVLILIIDWSEMYYSQTTKKIFITLDYAFLVLCMVTIYRELFQIEYWEFLFASFFLFAVTALHLLFNSHDTQLVLQQCHSQQIRKLQEDLVVKILIELKGYTQNKNSQVIEAYLYKLKDESNDPLFTRKIEQSEARGLQSKKDVIDNFVFKILKKGAVSSRRVRDLAIYLFSPNPRIYSFLDMKDWQHRRQYKRIMRQELNDSTLREAEAQKQIDEIKSAIHQYIKISVILFEELVKQRIKESKVEDYGEQLMELLQQLLSIGRADYIRSTQVKSLISRFAIQCLPPKYLSVVSYENMSEEREEMCELVLGGQEDNYMIVLEANTCFTKVSYLRREKYLLKHILEIFPPHFARNAQRYIKNLKKAEKNIQMQPTYFYNSLGFLVVCKFKVEATTHRSGRALKLSIRQELVNRNIVAINKGYVDGFSELCRYMGLSLLARQKRLRPAILEGIRTKQEYMAQRGQNILQWGQCILLTEATIQLLSQIKIESNTILLLQIKETGGSKIGGSQILSKMEEPVDFQFNINWQNVKFTTEPCNDHIKISAKFNEQKRLNINYGEDIVEMRYFEERIDYKSNFDEERDCPSLITQRENSRFNLSVNEFYQKWDRKNNTYPLWFKVALAITFSIFTLCLVSAVYFLTQFNSIEASARSNIQITTKLQEKLQSVVFLGSMTTLPSYDPTINVTEAINDQIKLTNSLSNQINSISPNLFNLQGQNILALMNNLNLYINSYLLNPSYSITTILKLVTTAIIPSFQGFISNIVSRYASGSNSIQRITVLIVLGVICLGLLIVWWVMQLKLSVRRKQVYEILKCVDNDDVQVLKDRMLKFKQIWLDNIDGKEFQQEKEEENKQNMSPPKHFLTHIQVSKAKIFQLIWLCIFAALSVQINWQISSFWQASTNYITFQNQLSSQVTNMQGVWAEFSVEKPNITLLKSFIEASLTNEYNKHIILKTMASSNQIQSQYVSSYQDFWEGDGYCLYLNNADCVHMMAGAFKEGAGMAICFLNMEHDSYLVNNMTNFSLTSQKSYHDVAQISLYYLPQITNANNGFILNEYNRMSKQYKLNIQYSFIGLVFHSLLSLVLVKLVLMEKKKGMRIEELLLIIPFEKVKNISLFHKYYLKYYAN